MHKLGYMVVNLGYRLLYRIVHNHKQKQKKKQKTFIELEYKTRDELCKKDCYRAKANWVKQIMTDFKKM